jgi:hypothetical protein
MTLRVSDATVEEVNRLIDGNDPTRFSQIFRLVLADIRAQYGGAQFRISNIPSAEDRDSFRWIEFALEMNSGVRNTNTDLVRANMWSPSSGRPGG